LESVGDCRAGLRSGTTSEGRALIKTNEYKRRQAAVGIRITPRGFGKDWRYPITFGLARMEDVA
jgi:hypothetical protein